MGVEVRFIIMLLRYRNVLIIEFEKMRKRNGT